MSDFVDWAGTARETERAILRAALALGLDWRDERALLAVVQEALDRRQGRHRAAPPARGIERQRMTLCALAVLRRRIEVAQAPRPLPPAGPHWQALSRLFDREIAARVGE